MEGRGTSRRKSRVRSFTMIPNLYIREVHKICSIYIKGFVFFWNFYFIYLKAWAAEIKGRGRKRRREYLPFSGVLPKWPGYLRLGQAHLHPGSPHGWRGLTATALPGTFSGIWIRSGAAKSGADALPWDAIFQLNSLPCNTSPYAFLFFPHSSKTSACLFQSWRHRAITSKLLDLLDRIKKKI